MKTNNSVKKALCIWALLITVAYVIACVDSDEQTEETEETEEEQQKDIIHALKDNWDMLMGYSNKEDSAQVESMKMGMEDETHDYNELSAFEQRISQGLLHYSKTGEVTPELEKDLKRVKEFKWEQTQETRQTQVQSIFKEVTVCSLCHIAVYVLQRYREAGGSKDWVDKALKKLCYSIQTKRVCDGLIDLNIEIFVYIFDQKKDLNANKVCSIIGQSLNCKASTKQNEWEVRIPPKTGNLTPQNYMPYDRPLRIMQITDIHYDHKYKAGSNAKCNEPLCCGVDQGEPKSPQDAAGYWGDYSKCDMPFYAVENLFQTAAQHDVDFIYHTGDIINHRVWETSVEQCSRSILDVTQLFRKYFHNKTVFHILGNHEPNPLNEFAPEQIIRNDLSTHWLYDLVAKEWATWLPCDTMPTIRKGGYYTVLVRPGFRVIALNSNVCYVYNWWLLFNDVDPYGQLQWLSDVLYQAELNGEYVHILSHVPSAEKECYKGWSNQYNKIITRFADIIKGQFVGHTHYNELNLYYENGKTDPVNVAFNGGSFTTYQDVNPNFRIYEVNPHNYQIENYEDWIFNITEANSNGQKPPRWFKLYSFKEAYGLPSMSLHELGQFANSLAYNSTRRQTYFRLKVRDGDPFLKKGCDNNCVEENMCNLVTQEFGEDDKCHRLLGEFRRAKNI